MSTDTTQLSNLAELLVEQSPDGVVFAGKEGIIRVWNRAAERIFGFKAEGALGALAHARDITERFEKERADRKRLLELEKTMDSKT
ncbi:MAG: PAS domain S-box protein [Deltaproteobacteria bacterium]|nr:PAS domain S-box protein [Deltaproteobacteria bacterium]